MGRAGCPGGSARPRRPAAHPARSRTRPAGGRRAFWGPARAPRGSPSPWPGVRCAAHGRGSARAALLRRRGSRGGEPGRPGLRVRRSREPGRPGLRACRGRSLWLPRGVARRDGDPGGLRIPARPDRRRIPALRSHRYPGGDARRDQAAQYQQASGRGSAVRCSCRAKTPRTDAARGSARLSVPTAAALVERRPAEKSQYARAVAASPSQAIRPSAATARGRPPSLPSRAAAARTPAAGRARTPSAD